jgi:hypothetical protein
VLKRAKSKMRYTYDFGDGWQHTIVLERSDVAPNPDQPALCLDGARACPPEDCGGIWGYARVLEAREHPDDPEYAETLEWLGDSFDPEAFSVDEVSKSLARIPWVLEPSWDNSRP